MGILNIKKLISFFFIVFSLVISLDICFYKVNLLNKLPLFREIIFLLIIIFFIFFLLRNNLRISKLNVNNLTKFFFTAWLFLLISKMFFTVNSIYQLLYVFKYHFQSIILFFIASYTLREKDYKNILKLLEIFFTFVSILLIIQYWLFSKHLMYKGRANLGSNPSMLSFFLSIILIYLLIETLEKNNLVKYIQSILFIISLLSLKTRTTYIAITFIIIFMFFKIFISGKNKKKITIMFIIIIILILIFSPFLSSFRQQINERINSISLESSSMLIRLNRWKRYTKNTSLISKILGSGTGAYGYIRFRFEKWGLVESTYMRIFLNHGIVGIFVFLGFIFSILYDIFFINYNKKKGKIDNYFFLYIMFLFLIHGLTIDPFQGIYLTYYLALILGYYYKIK